MTTKNNYEAIILADSISPAGHRLTTMEVTLPRFVLAEFNTHCMFARNSASSRAIPVEKRIAAVRENPFVPESFGKNQKGMQAAEAIEDQREARAAWLRAAHNACVEATRLAELGVHKQLANRLLELYCWHTVIVTATDWENFFAQRCHPHAQPEIRIAAELMRDAMNASEPQRLEQGEWHLPLVGTKYGDADFLSGHDGKPDLTGGLCGQMLGFHPAHISAARCARVSYLTHDGIRNRDADLELYEKLTTSGHMSPLEHPARPMTWEELEFFKRTEITMDLDPSYPDLTRKPETRITHYCAKFNGWVQLRKTVVGERVFSGGAS